MNKFKTCNDLLAEFNERRIDVIGEKLTFIGTKGKDVYNITKPFEDDGELIIAGRVERRDSEISEIMFFKEINGNWVKVNRDIKLNLQDPFITKISGELILGGVETYPHLIIEGYLGYRTVFYRGKNINNLHKFTQGSEMMKDIRLLELHDKRILVFTRPQGAIGGRGRIGYTIINNLDELNADVITNGELLSTQFIEAEWGGSNELHLLSNGLIGVLGHICCYDKDMNRYYFAMTFSFNLDTKEASPIKIIATRDNFTQGECKREDIRNVIFSGGITRLYNGKAELYVGVSDVESHKIVINDPFIQYCN